MSNASRSEAFVLAFILFICLLAAAHAEQPTPELVDSPLVRASAPPRPIVIGHRRRHAEALQPDAQRDIVRNENEFDRKFGMCRRC